MDPANRANIVLPYTAFDLEAKHPIYPNSTRYFPLRRAANSSQYRLGRVFLQEAYIIADYERSAFSVHQARLEVPMPSAKIVPIYPEKSSPNTANYEGDEPKERHSTDTKHSLSKGAIAGIAIGTWEAIGTCIILVLFGLHRRRKTRALLPQAAEPQYTHDGIYELALKDLSELPSILVHEMLEEPTELHDRAVSPVVLPEKCERGRVELPTGG
jgi:hypothetical protein